MREHLRGLLRAARFDGRDVDQLTDDVLRLLGFEGVDDQPATPDQPPGPVPA